MNKDHYKTILKVLVVSTLSLILLSLTPGDFWPKEMKKINILSDLMVNSTQKGDSPVAEESTHSLSSQSQKESNSTPSIENQSAKKISDLEAEDQIVKFEDYSENQTNLHHIKNRVSAIKDGHDYRIAFIGDSYIEADIITEHIRENLQERFGGGGVGFVPITSPASGYRRTIVNSSSGWYTHSMVQYKEADWKKITLSGYYFIPQEGATVSYQASPNYKFCDQFSSVKLIYTNEKHTVVKVLINNSEEKTYQLTPNKSMLTLDIKGNINSIKYTFTQTDGFTAYGVIASKREKGIHLDNFSVRGSSGLVLSIVNKEMSEQFEKILSHKLIVLQFGLNVLSPNTTNYSSYQKKMIGVVNHLKACNPQAQFIIMGIGDRSIKSSNGLLETMPGVEAMVHAQREVAKATGSIFWDTYKAMGGKNSMKQYANASPPLANKDYTHINHAGGKEIAKLFIKSLNYELEKPQ